MGNVPPEMGGILGNVCIYVECYWFLPRFYSGHKKKSLQSMLTTN